MGNSRFFIGHYGFLWAIIGFYGSYGLLMVIMGLY